MAAVLGRTLKRGLTCDCGCGGEEEVVYLDAPRRGLLNSAFAPFYIVVIALNTVAIGGGIMSQINFHRNRHGNGFYWVDGWYVINAMFGLFHILAAFFLVNRIEEPARHAPHDQFMAAEMLGAAPPHKSTMAREIVQRDPPYNPSIYNNNSTVARPQQMAPPVYYPNQPHSFPPYTSPTLANLGPTTEPETWSRIQDILCNSQIFAVYILVYIAYVIWHTLYDARTWNPTMLFVMRCADIFIIAGPASFALSIILLFVKRRQIR